MQPVMTHSTPRALRRRPDVIAQRVGETAVLVQLASNRIYELNATGARVWELLAEADSIDGLVSRLEAEFEIDHDGLAAEVSRIVSDLVTEGLVEHAGAR
jgi:hypothetical protein